MRNDQNSNRTAVTIFAVALIVALTAAFVMTFWVRNNTRQQRGTAGYNWASQIASASR